MSSNEGLLVDLAGGLHGTAGIIRWACANVRDGCESGSDAGCRLRDIADDPKTPLTSGIRLDRAATLLEQWVPA